MIKTLIITAALAAASCAFATTQNFITSVSYPSNPSGSLSQNQTFNNGTVFTASMSGVGDGGGAAYALLLSNGTMLAFVNTGAGAGLPFSATNSSSPLSGSQLVGIHLNISVDTSGAYGTASVSATW